MSPFGSLHQILFGSRSKLPCLTASLVCTSLPTQTVSQSHEEGPVRVAQASIGARSGWVVTSVGRGVSALCRKVAHQHEIHPRDDFVQESLPCVIQPATVFEMSHVCLPFVPEVDEKISQSSPGCDDLLVVLPGAHPFTVITDCAVVVSCHVRFAPFLIFPCDLWENAKRLPLTHQLPVPLTLQHMCTSCARTHR